MEWCEVSAKLLRVAHHLKLMNCLFGEFFVWYLLITVDRGKGDPQDVLCPPRLLTTCALALRAYIVME